MAMPPASSALPSLPVLTVASPLHDAASVRRLTESLAPALRTSGAEPTSDPAVADRPGPLAVLVLTGGTEQAVLAAHARHGAVDTGAPALLLAHPGHNSLPAALEALARLHQDGCRGVVVTIGAGETGSARLEAAVADLRAWHRLHDIRIGRIGTPSDWLVASSPEPEVVRATWGPTVIDVAVEDVVGALAAAPVGSGAALADDVAAGAVRVREPRRADLDRAAGVATILDDLVDRHALDAVTVRCFDLVTDAATSGCLALSELNDRGVVAGCEGDLPSTIGLLWAHELLAATAWMANPAEADPEAGRILLAHCTAPRSLLSDYEVRSHFESGLGAAIGGTLPAGPVTLLRIGGRDLTRLWLAEGVASSDERREDLCRTQVTVDLAPEAVAELLARPLGNHVVLVPGRHADRLQAWWRAFVAPVDEASGASPVARTS